MSESTTENGIRAGFRLSYPDFVLDSELHLPTEGFTALYGRSGCGKTTLLRCMAGLHKAAGHMYFGGTVWQDQNTFVPTHRRPLAYVFQEPRLFPHLNVRGNLHFGFDRLAAAERRVPFDAAVAWLGLEALLGHKPDQLSGGQQQRVAIARALLSSPRLLLMDEPLANLDLDSKADILPCLEQLRTALQLPVIYVTHAPDEVARLADHLVLMDAGRIVACGPLNLLLTRTDLPLSHDDDASAVVEATIAAHDAHYHISEVVVPGGRLSVALSAHPVGSKTRIRILARDVSIALQPPRHSSIQNSLPARVVDINPDRDAGSRLVRLDIGGTPILSRITHRSADQLALAPGMLVHVQIKSVALMR